MEDRFHPTIYGHLSNIELIEQYRWNVWEKSDENHRQQLMQETTNREAKAQGLDRSCEVRFVDLENSNLGNQGGEIIQANRSIFAKDQYVSEFEGKKTTKRVFNSNFRALEMVLHEQRHDWQNQCIQGNVIRQNPFITHEFKSNNFTTSLIVDEKGYIKTGSHYLNSGRNECSQLMYYFQSTERDTHYYAEKRTMEAIKYLDSKHEKELSSELYKRFVERSGYDAMYKRGQNFFGHKDFDKEINQVLMNHYYHTKDPVEPSMKRIVENEMIASREKQLEIVKENMEVKDMEKNYTPVTIEQYDQTLRDSVNAYYEHAMNDPHMSQEEAIQTTHEMSERYLEEMEQVEAAYQNEGTLTHENSHEMESENDMDTSTNEVEVVSQEESVEMENGDIDEGGVEDSYEVDDGYDDDSGIE